MRKALWFIGIMAQVGVFTIVAAILWLMTNMEALELMCISGMVSITFSLPVLMSLDEWGEKN